MRPALLLLLATALAVQACAQEAKEPAQTRQQASESTQEIDPTFNAQEERATKKQWQERASDSANGISPNGINKRVSEIDWAEAKSFQQAELAGLTEEQRDRLIDAPVPALLPNRAELFGEVTVTSGEHWYAASLDGDAHSVYVSGTRLVTVVEGLELADELADDLADEAGSFEDDFRITRTDAIVSLSVNAFGAAYTIEVECARPGEDARCLEDDYVVSLANALVLPEGQTLPRGGLK
jgi:hypothetical protein